MQKNRGSLSAFLCLRRLQNESKDTSFNVYGTTVPRTAIVCVVAYTRAFGAMPLFRAVLVLLLAACLFQVTAALVVSNLVLYDGVCRFCNTWVSISLRMDRSGRLKGS